MFGQSAMSSVALAWRKAATPAVVVHVLAHQGSVPREAGTRMLVAADAVVGTIGGGHLEFKAIADARALLAGQAVVQRQRVALGPSLGQCCGGALELAFTRLSDVQEQELAAWGHLPPRFHLQLYGAGHVGRAIVNLLETLPCAVTWIDERESEFPASSSAPHIQRLCVEPVQAEVAHAPPGCCFLVLTHSHDLDLALTHAILARGDFAFFGLIGSKTKRARFEHRLLERGHSAAAVARITCPIGVPGVVGKEPEVLAVAVVAQLLQVQALSGQ